jgi:biopolymer transport protein ExbD
MAFKYRYKPTDEAELDVTAFLNLMIVLVPVLLLTLTFTQISVLEIKLPELTGGFTSSADKQSKLEVVINEKGIKVFYPENRLIQDIPKIPVEEGTSEEGELKYDFEKLSTIMQALKKEFLENKKLQEKKDAVVMSCPTIGYQSLVSTMDAVKSYKTVVVSSVAEVELFPEISLGDAKC